MCLGAELGFEARNAGQRRIDQTFGLNDVEARGRTGFELKLGEVQRLAAGLQVVLRDLDQFLIVAGRDIGIGDVRQKRQARRVDAGIGRVEVGERCFLRTAVEAEEIEEPGGLKTAANRGARRRRGGCTGIAADILLPLRSAELERSSEGRPPAPAETTLACA